MRLWVGVVMVIGPSGPGKAFFMFKGSGYLSDEKIWHLPVLVL